MSRLPTEAAADAPLRAHDEVMRFAARYGRDSVRLAMHAAVPHSMRPELLHLLRVNFLPELTDDASSEADVLFAPFTQELGGGFFRFDDDVRRELFAYLLQTYATEPVPRVRRVAHFLLAFVERDARAGKGRLWEEWAEVQRWVAAAFLDPTATAEAFAGMLAKRVAGGRAAVRARRSALADALALPLDREQALIAYAAGIEAGDAGDRAAAEAWVGSLGDEELTIGDVTLPVARTVLASARMPLAESVEDLSSGQVADEGGKDQVAKNDRVTVFVSGMTASGDHGFARRLEADLRARGFSIEGGWKVVEAQTSGAIGETYIRGAIERSDRCLFVASTDSGQSKWATVELSWVREFCKPVVTAIRHDGDLPNGLATTLTIDFRGNDAYEEALNDLVTALLKPVPPLGELHGVGKPLSDRQPNQRVVRQVIERLTPLFGQRAATDDKRRPIGLVGGKSSGKTPTAIAVARDCAVRRAFPDGVYWLSVDRLENDEQAFDLILEWIAPGPPPFSSIVAAQDKMDRFFRNRRCLVVLDDIPQPVPANDTIVRLIQTGVQVLFSTGILEQIPSLFTNPDLVDLVEELEKKAETISKLVDGARLPGVVKNITDYGVLIDLGGIDGLLHITDISWGRVNHPSEHFSVGDEVEVVILKFDPETERISLGYKQKSDDPWTLVDKKYPIGSRVHGKVVSLVDYGAFIEIEEGVEGLIHVSEMSWTKKVVNPAKILKVGDEVEAIVSELDMDQRRISLSLRQTEHNPWQELDNTHPVGTIIEGKVRNLTEFGAFVEITEGIDGLIHVSDMSWTRRVKHPSEVLKKGDVVKARITNIDTSTQRVSLSIKEFMLNEWEEFVGTHHVGDTVDGKVVNVTGFGLFIDVYLGVEGLAHVSEIDLTPGAKLEGYFEIGDWVRARILRIEDDDKKVGLTMRGLQQPTSEEVEELEKLAAEQSDAFTTRQAANDSVKVGVPEAERAVEEPEQLKALRAAEESATLLEGKVFGWNRGGFHVALKGGVSAFCPNSEMELRRPRSPESYIGRSLSFRVIKVQRRGRRVVLSRRAILKEERERLARENLRGAILTGRVTSITDFGLFIDIHQGFEGLAHVSEIDLAPGVELEDHYQIGDWVRVRIMRIDDNEEEVALTMRGLLQPSAKDVEALEQQATAASSGKSSARAAKKSVAVETAEEKPVEDEAQAWARDAGETASKELAEGGGEVLEADETDGTEENEA